MHNRISVFVGAAALTLFAPIAGAFSIGQAWNYAILTAPGAKNIQMSNSVVNGNWGIGDPYNDVNLSSGTLNGNLDFAGTADPDTGSATITGSVNSNVAAVTNAWNKVSALSDTLGASAGTAINITGGGQTIFANTGNLVGTDRVFTVGSFDLGGGITISGGATDWVVLNFDNGTSNVALDGGVSLTGGITQDRVLFNLIGSGGELKGNTNDTVNGLFLFKDLKLNINDTTINGRLMGGNAGDDFQYVSGMEINASVVPIPAAVWLFGSALGMLGWMRRKA